jgi:hypothetical protein
LLAPRPWVCLHDGTRISGRQLQLSADGATLTTGSGDPFSAPYGQIAAIFFRAARPSFEAPTDGIRIISATGDVLDAPLADVDTEGVFIDINPNVDPIHLPTDRLSAIVWSARKNDLASENRGAARVELRSGEVFVARVTRLDGQALEMQTPAGPRVIPRREVVALRAARLVSAQPASPPPEDTLRPAWRLNSNALGLPLRMGGRAFKTGIGLHAPVRVTLPVPPQALWFVALAGADADAAPFARVKAEIQVDGQSAWKLDAAAPGQPPRYAAVKVNGAREVTLVVESAGDDHTACLGDFAHAAFIVD